MTLTGPDAIEGLYHFMKPETVPAGYVVVMYSAGRRYGGFRDIQHAQFVAKHLKLDNPIIRVVAEDEA